MTTVSEQMPDEERRRRLMHGLRATGNDTVVVEFAHLAQAVGMDAAEKLATRGIAETNEYQTSQYSSKLRKKRAGICEVDRLAVLEACKQATEKHNKSVIDNRLMDENE
jgi:hypothetical protein